MTVSKMKFLKVLAVSTEYRIMCFKFGGGDFFDGAGYGTYDYICGVVLGANPAMLLDRVGGAGYYAVEKAGYVAAEDLATAWEWILRHFDTLPVEAVMELEKTREGEWKVGTVYNA